ncbi:uncharacterized protein [Petaurus breviceps papuanus]|uniref:uncharacterized protein n=1 Tax=Petaurus breviceps papuanus TaxID=3040969 RepID=UPI0036DB8D5F
MAWVSGQFIVSSQLTSSLREEEGSMEGSMDSLYEPVPEQQNSKEDPSPSTNTYVKSGESKRSSMITELDGNQVESMGTLQRLWKLVGTKKSSMHSLDEFDHTLTPLNSPQDSNHSEEEDDTLISCMKLMKSQEKKACKDNTMKSEETESRVDFISPSLGRFYTSTSSYVEDISPHPGNEFQIWNDWKTFTENQLWPRDFLISQTARWGSYTCSAHHSRLTSSLLDMDLPHPWGLYLKHKFSLHQWSFRQEFLKISYFTLFISTSIEVKAADGERNPKLEVAQKQYKRLMREKTVKKGTPVSRLSQQAKWVLMRTCIVSNKEIREMTDVRNTIEAGCL